VKDEDSSEEKAGAEENPSTDEQPVGQTSEEPGQKVENESPE
jgi:hypothetical protein